MAGSEEKLTGQKNSAPESNHGKDEYPSLGHLKKQLGNVLRGFLAQATYVNSNRLSPIVGDRPLKEYGIASLGYAMTEDGLIDLRPLTEIEVPNDIVSESDGKLAGTVHYFQLNEEDLELKESDFHLEIAEPLSPFKYKKPIIKKDVFNPDEVWENDIRQGYYPLLIVKNAYRGPNHWHRRDDALFCAVKDSTNSWSIKYFPKLNIPKETWEEAVAKLN